MSVIYFAYGKDMDEEVMQERCPGAKFLGTAVMKEYRIVFKGSRSGYLSSMEPTPGFTTPGVLWEFDEAKLEEFDQLHEVPNMYYRTEVTVEADGKPQKVMTYIIHEEKDFGLPRAAEYNRMDAAYQKYGFENKILVDALSYSRLQCAPKRHAIIHMQK